MDDDMKPEGEEALPAGEVAMPEEVTEEVTTPDAATDAEEETEEAA
jgi:hypothetical protein